MTTTLNNEQQVKNVLGIDSWRNLSKEKIMEFVSLIPNMDKEVAISIVNQFPAYTEMAKCMIAELGKTCDKAMSENTSSQNQVLAGYRKTIDTLAELVNRDDISPEERAEITRLMIEVADKMAAKDTENKEFLAWTIKAGGYLVLCLVVVGGAILGINIKGRAIPVMPR